MAAARLTSSVCRIASVVSMPPWRKTGAGIEHGIVETIPAQIANAPDQSRAEASGWLIGDDIGRPCGDQGGHLVLRLAARQQEFMPSGKPFGERQSDSGIAAGDEYTARFAADHVGLEREGGIKRRERLQRFKNRPRLGFIDLHLRHQLLKIVEFLLAAKSSDDQETVQVSP
jgi:hypothetical protein